MKAFDTNVLVRLLIADDERQARKVRAVLREAESRRESYVVTATVVLELLWVLESVYQCPREDVLRAVERLTRMPVLEFEHRGSIQRFLEEASRSKQDLPDILMGMLAVDLGCETTLTFDRGAARSRFYELM